MTRNQIEDLVTNEKEVAEEFKNYFKALLNNTISRPAEETYLQCNLGKTNDTKKNGIWQFYAQYLKRVAYLKQKITGGYFY